MAREEGGQRIKLDEILATFYTAEDVLTPLRHLTFERFAPILGRVAREGEIVARYLVLPSRLVVPCGRFTATPRAPRPPGEPPTEQAVLAWRDPRSLSWFDPSTVCLRLCPHDPAARIERWSPPS